MEIFNQEIKTFWSKCFNEDNEYIFATASENSNMKNYLAINTNISQNTIDTMFLCCFMKRYDIELINDLFNKYNANLYVTMTMNNYDKNQHIEIDCIDAMGIPIYKMDYNINNDVYLCLYMSYVYKNNDIECFTNKFTFNKVHEIINVFGYNFLGDLLKFCKKNNIKLFHKNKIMNDHYYYGRYIPNFNSIICDIVTYYDHTILFKLIKYTKHYITIDYDFMKYGDYSYMLNDLWNLEDPNRREQYDHDEIDIESKDKIYQIIYYLASLGLMYTEGKKLKKICI